MTVGHRHRNAAPDRGRRVGHRADHGALGLQVPLEACQRAAGGNRKDHGLFAGELRQRREHLVHHLRLDRDHHHGRRLGQRADLGTRLDAVLAQQRAGARRRRGVLHDDPRRVEPTRQPTGQERVAHVAHAGEKERAIDLEGHANTTQICAHRGRRTGALQLAANPRIVRAKLGDESVKNSMGEADKAPIRPGLRSGTWCRRAPRGSPCRPRPRTGRPGSSARRPPVPPAAAPRIVRSWPACR